MGSGVGLGDDKRLDALKTGSHVALKLGDTVVDEGLTNLKFLNVATVGFNLRVDIVVS